MKKLVFWDYVGFFTIAFILLGQVIVGWGYLLGQTCFLVGNIASLIRCFKINQPLPDKVKNVCFTSLTVGLVVIGFLK